MQSAKSFIQQPQQQQQQQQQQQRPPSQGQHLLSPAQGPDFASTVATAASLDLLRPPPSAGPASLSNTVAGLGSTVASGIIGVSRKARRNAALRRRLRTCMLTVYCAVRWVFATKYAFLTLREAQAAKNTYDQCGGITSYIRAQQVMAELGHSIPGGEIQRVLDDAHYTDGHVMTLKQFERLLMYKKKEFLKNSTEDVTLIAYVALGGNINGTGAVDSSLLVDAVREFGLKIDIEKLIREVDIDNSGQLDLEEFRLMLSLAPSDAASEADPNTPLLLGSRGSTPKNSVFGGKTVGSGVVARVIDAVDEIGSGSNNILGPPRTSSSRRGSAVSIITADSTPKRAPMDLAQHGSVRGQSSIITPLLSADGMGTRASTTTLTPSDAPSGLPSPMMSLAQVDATEDLSEAGSSNGGSAPGAGEEQGLALPPSAPAYDAWKARLEEEARRRPKPNFNNFLKRAIKDIDCRKTRETQFLKKRTEQQASGEFHVAASTTLPQCLNPPVRPSPMWNAKTTAKPLDAPKYIDSAPPLAGLAARRPFETTLPRLTTRQRHKPATLLSPLNKRYGTPSSSSYIVTGMTTMRPRTTSPAPLGPAAASPTKIRALATMDEIKSLRDDNPQWNRWLQGGEERGVGHRK
eukprot:PhM_4_TR9028/c0_g1_i1/m.105626